MSGPENDQTQSQNDNRNSRSHSKEKAKVKTQTFMDKYMDKWVEPPVAAAPSYLDHGGLPYGVLDSMQPLGELPNAKVKGRVKGEGARKSVLGRASAVDAQETQETPQPPTPQPADLPAAIPPVIDDEKDDDYAPKVNGGKRRDRTTRNRPGAKRASQPASSVTPVPQTAPTPAPVQTLPAAPATMATPTPTPAPARTPSAAPIVQLPAHPAEYGGDKLKRVVEAAKARAIEVGKPDLAAAVNEIYEQSQSDLNLRILLQAILSQRASHDQNIQFQDYVRAAKKKLKDATKQRERQHPAASKVIETQPKPVVKPLPTKLSLQSTPLLQAPGSSQALPSTEIAEPVRSSNLSLKLKSPSKHHHHQGKPDKSGGMSVSPKKPRAGSVGSESSLTDLTSNDDMDTDEDDELQPGPVPTLAAGARVNGVKGRDQAAERGSLTVPATLPGGSKRSSADAELESDRDKVLAAKKQKLGESVTRQYDYQESSVRPAVSALKSRTQKVRSEALTAPRLSLHASGSRTGSRAGSIRPGRADSTDLDSPLSSPAGSRQGTPKVFKPAPKPFGKRAKTKQSPEKKQLGSLGAVGGALRESPVRDDNEERSENNDFCSACNGSGYLLCCDGCDRSFHFTCLDPPLNANAKELDEPWFCFICVANRPLPLESPEKGQTRETMFTPLLRSLKKRNPRNFELPQELREHFEGVTSDKNGNFIESVNTKPSRNRPGYSEEQPDHVRLRDSKGVLVTCYSCGLSSQNISGPKRPIVNCDHCHQNWHLDCLDPPLANAPSLSQNGKKVHDWMCPLHADQELRNVTMSQLNRTVHVRKPKTAKIVQTALSRGHRNNGIIEVADEESDASDSEFYDLEAEGGTVYKLPSSGIKLDFIDKVKNTRVQQLRDDHVYQKRARLSRSHTPRGPAAFSQRPIQDQQAAMHLAQFASQNNDLDLGVDQVQNLVGALIAEAPAEVVKSMTDAATQAASNSAAAPLSPPSSEQVEELSAEQRKELEMLQELIRRRLEGSKT